jgi:virginiamycin A acetyltransferase
MKRAIFKFYSMMWAAIKMFFRPEKSPFSDSSVRLSGGHLSGNIQIAAHTYINSGHRIVTGENSRIVIGKYCAIGRNFSCASRTHSLTMPTADENNIRHRQEEADITIGNYVWIGDNVVIKHGITVADYAVIGANSVVTKNVRPFEIVGGVPAKHIRFNTDHYLYSSLNSPEA